MPLLIILFLLADLFSIAFLVFDYYLWREWYEYRNTAAEEYANRCLYGALALLIFIFLGKSLIKLLFSKRRMGEDQPQFFKPEETDTITRPDGTVINIEYYGKENAQPLIFIHGWNSNIKGWYYQRKYFEKGYRLIMMDLPGLGKSTRPSNKDFALDKMAADLSAVIAHSGVSNPILWGHSIGGMTILTLLAKHPELLKAPIKAIILEHTTYTNPVKTIIFNKLLTAIQKPVLVPLCYVLIALSPIIWINRWMSYLNGNSHIITRWLTFAGTQTAAQLDFVTLLSTLAPPAVTARGVLGMFKYDVTNQLSQIQIPALVIAADKDRLTKPVASTFMTDRLPKGELVTVTPANHQGLVERHREVNEAVEKFITKLG